MLSVGKILRAHGVRGEIKAECFTDAPSCLVHVKRFFIDGKEYLAEKARVQGGFLLLKLATIDDMNAAETLRNKEIFAKKEDLPALPKGRFYIEDVLGATVFCGEEKLGKLTDILQYGSADVYVVTLVDGKTVLFPYVGNVVETVDVDGKKITLNKTEFSKVAVYED